MQARKIIATALNVSESAIKNWELGLRNPKPEYMAAIELITEGKVRLDKIMNQQAKQGRQTLLSTNNNNPEQS